MKEILEKLIPHYEQTISYIQESPSYWTKILEIAYVNKGICYCSLHKFNKDIYPEQWVTNEIPAADTHWCEKPESARNWEEAIEYLQFRLDKMKSLLNS